MTSRFGWRGGRLPFHAGLAIAPDRWSAKPLTPAALIVYAFALALGLGVSTAWFAVSGEYPIGAVRVGPWTSWPQVGSSSADPYARAIVTRRAEIPLATGEGLALTATIDGQGRDLDSACTYRVGSTTPQARLWTLTIYDRNGALVSSELERSGFTSTEVLREPDGRFFVALSRQLQPGNWLKLPAGGRFSMTLRLYDTPAALGAGAVDPRSLPAIERTECGA
jgi:hypothetical protein